MNKVVYLFIIFFFISGCSFNKNSKFWTATKKIQLERNFEEVLKDNQIINKQFNPNIKVKLDNVFNINLNESSQLNNYGRINFDSELNKISRYKFSKIKNFHQYEPEILFYKNKVLFFDNKGTILQFNEDSKLIWKKTIIIKQKKNLTQFCNLLMIINI